MTTISDKDLRFEELATYIENRSKEICADNGCTEDNHNCDGYAYISESGKLIDICCSDYFQGWGSEDEKKHGKCAAIPLPWSGSGEDLKKDVENDCDEQKI